MVLTVQFGFVNLWSSSLVTFAVFSPVLNFGSPAFNGESFFSTSFCGLVSLEFELNFSALTTGELVFLYLSFQLLIFSIFY